MCATVQTTLFSDTWLPCAGKLSFQCALICHHIRDSNTVRNLHIRMPTIQVDQARVLASVPMSPTSTIMMTGDQDGAVRIFTWKPVVA